MADPNTTVPEVSTVIPNINPPPQMQQKPSYTVTKNIEFDRKSKIKEKLRQYYET